MKRFLNVLETTLKILLATAVLVWVLDWAVFTLRAARGSGFDSVQVQEYLSTALKGNKQEFDYMGTAPVTCARALFPHGGASPCWWLRRHTIQWE